MDLLSTSPDLVGGGMWMMDRACPACHRCGRPFSVQVRRHHCRICGFIFCSSCSNHFIQTDIIPDVLRTAHVKHANAVAAATSSNEQHSAFKTQNSVLAMDDFDADLGVEELDTVLSTDDDQQPEPLFCLDEENEENEENEDAKDAKGAAAVDVVEYPDSPPPAPMLLTIPEEASDNSFAIVSTFTRKLSNVWSSVCSAMGQSQTVPRVRVCRACRDAVVRANNSKRMIEVFSLNEYLSSRDYHAMAQVCREWNGAARVLRRIWTDTITPFAPQTKNVTLQRRVIAQHTFLARTDARVAIVCAKHGVNIDSGVSGSLRFPSLGVAECLQVIMELSPQHPLHHHAKVRLTRFPTQTLLPFVNVLIVLAADFDPSLQDLVLLRRCVYNAEFAHRCYWYARSRPTLSQRLLADKIMRSADETIRAQFNKTGVWVTTLQLLGNVLKESKKESGSGGSAQQQMCDLAAHAQRHARVLQSPTMLPGTASVRVNRIYVQTMAQVSSASCPFVFQAELEDVITEVKSRKTIMIKHDPQFWNEVCVANIHEHLGNVSEWLRDIMQTYHVCPLAQNVGLVVFVDGAASLLDLQEKGTSVLRHVVKSAPRGTDVAVMEERFRQSVAFSCVVALMLGYGDRHLGNLVLANGKLVNIDFGWIMSREPDSKRFLPAPHRVRLTPELMETIGADCYDVFLDECTDVNIVLRKHAHDVYWLLYPLVQTFASRQDVVMHLRTFVMPNVRIEHVDMVLKRVISSTTLRSSKALMWLLDKIHSFGQYVGS